jgi:hypothetical protein
LKLKAWISSTRGFISCAHMQWSVSRARERLDKKNALDNVHTFRFHCYC